MDDLAHRDGESPDGRQIEVSILLSDLATFDRAGAQDIVRDPLATQARRFIVRQLSSGAWKPGHRLTIRSLALQLGISTTPVREVLMQLVSTGCLELKQNTAFTVPSMSLDAYLETRRLRVLLEGEGSAAAADRATPQEIETLGRIQSRYTAAEEAQDVPGSLEWNRAFHLSLAEMSRLPTLVTFVETLWLRSGPMLNALYPRMKPWQQETFRHDTVLPALRERDPEMARTAIRDDIIAGGWQLEATLRGEVL